LWPGGHRANLLEQAALRPVQTEPIRRILPAIFSASAPPDCYFILLNRAATSDKKSVDLSAHLPKSFCAVIRNSTVRHQRSLRRRTNDFYGIDWRRTGIFVCRTFPQRAPKT